MNKGNYIATQPVVNTTTTITYSCQLKAEDIDRIKKFIHDKYPNITISNDSCMSDSKFPLCHWKFDSNVSKQELIKAIDEIDKYHKIYNTDSHFECISSLHEGDSRFPVYQCRSECMHDITQIKKFFSDKLPGMTINDIHLEKDPELPDCDWVFECDSSLEKLRQRMKWIEKFYDQYQAEPHVMYQTLALQKDYTGKRDYDL